MQEFLFDSLVPSDYRDLEALLAPPNNLPRSYPTLAVFDTPVARLRSLVTLRCLRTRAAGDQAVVSWIQQEPVGPMGLRFEGILSIGQHSGMRTQYLDASSCFSVACWFATHTFPCGSLQPNRRAAAVYRFHHDTLVSTAAASSAIVLHDDPSADPDYCRLVRLGGVRSALAARPSAQEG